MDFIVVYIWSFLQWFCKVGGLIFTYEVWVI